MWLTDDRGLQKATSKGRQKNNWCQIGSLGQHRMSTQGEGCGQQMTEACRRWEKGKKEKRNSLLATNRLKQVGLEEKMLGHDWSQHVTTASPKFARLWQGMEVKNNTKTLLPTSNLPAMFTHCTPPSSALRSSASTLSLMVFFFFPFLLPSASLFTLP